MNKIQQQKINRNVNWKNWEKLLKHLCMLEEFDPQRFNMSRFLQALMLYGEANVSVAELRADDQECGSAGCLFGEAVLACGAPSKTFYVNRLGEVDSNDIYRYATELLGLPSKNDDLDGIASYIYDGRWALNILAFSFCEKLKHIKLTHAIAYVTKALMTKNIFVTVDCTPEVIK